MKKQIYNACYRARDFGYLVDPINKIIFIKRIHFECWITHGVDDCIKFLQGFNFRIILK